MYILLLMITVVVGIVFPPAFLLTALLVFVAVNRGGEIRTLNAKCQQSEDGGVFLRAGVGRFVEVVGESHYMKALKAIKCSAAEPDANIVATLIPEPNNNVDRNAIAIEIAGHKVGYLKRSDGQTFRSTYGHLLEKGKTVQCWGKLIGGTDDKPNIGVFLSFNLHEAAIRKTMPS